MQMPPRTDRLDVDLDVGYRASAEPQTVDVRVKSSGPAELPYTPWAAALLVECVNRGLAGGREFSPSAGSAVLEAGPTGEGAPQAGELGPDYSFRLRVAGVSPLFLRTMVESLSTSAHPSACTAVSIVGSLALDGSPLSVRSAQLSEWLRDADAYPGAWPVSEFRVVDEIAARGAAVRVTLQTAAPGEVAAEFERTVSAWQSAIRTMPNLARTARGWAAPQAAFACTRTELFARLELFDHAPPVARAALVNALAWFHARVAPLAEARIALP